MSSELAVTVLPSTFLDIPRFPTITVSVSEPDEIRSIISIPIPATLTSATTTLIPMNPITTAESTTTTYYTSATSPTTAKKRISQKTLIIASAAGGSVVFIILLVFGFWLYKTRWDGRSKPLTLDELEKNHWNQGRPDSKNFERNDTCSENGVNDSNSESGGQGSK
ncbi:hypothetical protein BDR26DRAFT_922720 [Obelidium mucronatum]|nr:hypothetical protein BDR26DRAFT_922720 [Obelidium mucronatum]